jgi:peptide deformylase
MLAVRPRSGKFALAPAGTPCDSDAMAVLKVARLGHPILRQRAEPISPEAIGAPEIQRLIDDMLETMNDHDGAGLAAPQVHVSRRLVVYGVQRNPRYPDAEEVPLTVLVNPVITPATGEEDEDWEGCLSVPDLRGQVPRVTRVQVQAHGRDGRRLAFTADGFHARVVQHECDHLDGIVYLDRMRSMATLSFLPEFHRYWLGREP